jgi:hypothetical protein
MELDIKQILLEYNKIDLDRQNFNKFVLSEDFSSSKKTADESNFQGSEKLSGLNQNFYPVVDRLMEFLKSKSCRVRFTSGHRPVKTNTKSLHPQGRAIDFVFTDNARSCISHMTEICKALNNEFRGVNCINEYASLGGKKTKDWSGDHYHIDFSGQASKKTTGTQELANQPTSTGDEIQTNDGDSQQSSGLGANVLKMLGASILSRIMDGYQITKPLILNENFYFGKRITDANGYYIIPARYNSEIKSPINGIVISENLGVGNCPNSVIIKNSGLNIKLQYCNLSSKSVNLGDRVLQNQEIGKTNNLNDVFVYAHSIQTQTKPKNNRKKEEDDDNDWSKEERKKWEDKERKEKLKQSGDPAVHYLASLPVNLVKRLFRKKKKNKEEENESKLNENIQRIKKLL